MPALPAFMPTSAAESFVLTLGFASCLKRCLKTILHVVSFKATRIFRIAACVGLAHF